MDTKPIRDIIEFRTRRDAILRTFGERLISGTPEDNSAIRKAAEPLARYGRIPVEKMVSVLMQRHIEATTPTGASHGNQENRAAE